MVLMVLVIIFLLMVKVNVMILLQSARFWWSSSSFSSYDLNSQRWGERRAKSARGYILIVAPSSWRPPPSPPCFSKGFCNVKTAPPQSPPAWHGFVKQRRNGVLFPPIWSLIINLGSQALYQQWNILLLLILMFDSMISWNERWSKVLVNIYFIQSELVKEENISSKSLLWWESKHWKVTFQNYHWSVNLHRQK